MLLPITLKDHIYEGSLEEAIHLIVEEKLDLEKFNKLYNNDETGRLAYHPKVLLKVILLAYSRGIIGSRRIEKACRENILFLALAGGHQPDHSTIAAFITSMGSFIMDFFIQVLLICSEMDLLQGTHFSIDGCKLPSNASKEHSATFKELKKRRGKLKEKLKTLIHQHITTDQQDEDIRQAEKARFQRRVKRIEKQIKRIERFLETEEPKEGKNGTEIQSNITDNQSAKMPTAHGVIQGYNAQAAVDSKHQIIVHAEAMGNGQDSDHLKPMIEGLNDNMKALDQDHESLDGAVITADSNYHTNENITYCEEQNIDAYIPDTNFRKRDPRFANQQRFKDGVNKPPKKKNSSSKFSLSDFAYEQQNDVYICPAGQRLELRTAHQENKGIVYRSYFIKDDSCGKCPLRHKCLSSETSKRRYLSVPVGRVSDSDKPPSPSARMQEKIDSPAGKEIYSERLGNVEPVFGNIRYNKRLDRFTYRSKVKVNTQWLLFCLIHNMEKIAHCRAAI